MNLSIFSKSQQDDALTRAIKRMTEVQEGIVGPDSVLARVNEVGVEAELVVDLYTSNLPDPDGSDPRSLCEGFLLGVKFVQELEEG